MSTVSLKPYNTFGVSHSCAKLVSVYSEIDVYKAMVYNEGPFKIIGGGSNILITKDIPETVLLNEIKGVSVIDEDDQTTLVGVGAGEYWHLFIQWCLSHNLGGLENLSLIPGKVGAAPIQNIGAYGVEQVDCFHSLRAIDMEEGTSRIFYKEDCRFGYRDSIFKHELKGRYFITQVNYLLQKKHTLCTAYGAITERLAERQITEPTIRDVSDAIIAIRQSKLPDPNMLPNAGSFFKNPVVENTVLETLKREYPTIKYYAVDEMTSKIPAAWLIEQAGYKGVQTGKVGTHKDHALVIVNYDNGTGSDIYKLSEEIIETVKKLFSITLEREVNVW